MEKIREVEKKKAKAEERFEWRGGEEQKDHRESEGEEEKLR